MRTSLRFAATGAALLGIPLSVGVAFADPAGARAAYDVGAKAHEAGHFVEAAHAFAEADRLAPNEVALGAALDEALLADDAPLLGELAERADLRHALPKLVAKARARIKGRVGGIRVVCGRAGSVTVDRASVDFSSTVWLLPGPHTVAWAFADTVSTLQTVDVPADVIVTASCAVALAPLREPSSSSPPIAASTLTDPSPPGVRTGTAVRAGSSPPTTVPGGRAAPTEPEGAHRPVEAPAPSPQPPRSPSAGLSPAYFAGAAAATVGVGILGVFANGSVTRANRALDGCTGVVGDDPQFCGDERRRVDDASTVRTAVWVGAGAMALGTIALGVFGTRWRSSAQVTATVAPHEVGVGFQRRF